MSIVWMNQPGVPAELKEMVERDFVRQVSNILCGLGKFDASFLLEMDRIAEKPLDQQAALLDAVFENVR